MRLILFPLSDLLRFFLHMLENHFGAFSLFIKLNAQVLREWRYVYTSPLDRKASLSSFLVFCFQIGVQQHVPCTLSLGFDPLFRLCQQSLQNFTCQLLYCLFRLVFAVLHFSIELQLTVSTDKFIVFLVFLFEIVGKFL